VRPDEDRSSHPFGEFVLGAWSLLRAGDATPDERSACPIAPSGACLDFALGVMAVWERARGALSPLTATSPGDIVAVAVPLSLRELLR
jgi:hypothetical protein